jgi:hypothetical protein
MLLGMPSPFPGMDPYLEHPDIWPDVQNAVLAELRLLLGRALRPNYIVSLEERTYADVDGLLFVGRPDLLVRGPEQPHAAAEPQSDRRPSGVLEVEVPTPDRNRETWLEVRTQGAGDVVTVLELLSPANKRSGRGRAIYQQKRDLVLETRTNLVEIDLLRAGEPMPLRGTPPRADYRVLVSRGDRRPRADLFLFSVRDPFPDVLLPLRGDEVGPKLDLRAAFDRVYDAASYDLRTDYASEPIPPIGDVDVGWVDSLLRASGDRPGTTRPRPA